MRCATCGSDNRESARFCDGCGARLDAPPPQETRRTVTIVFVDVVGSTALGERLDPEAVRQTMTDFFELVRGVVERHGGMVEKYIGDAAMAVFGLPTLHEDDALRAVRAGAEVRERLATSGLAGTIAVRIGIETGDVIAGDPTSGQRLVTGDAVNTAARLEQAAAVGEILVGPGTRQLVRASVTAEAIDPIHAKGKALPVPAWRVSEVEAHGELAPRRLDAPLVGRTRELGRLRRSFEDAVAERRCGLFTLLGAAGVGKSRLVHELVALVRDEATVLRGRCLPYGEGITFWPIGEIVRSAAGIDEADTRDVAIAKLRGLVQGEPDAERIGDLVAIAVGLQDSEADRDQLFWAIRRLFEWLARERPLVVVIDDLHWAEPTFLDLVEQVADWSRGAPILLLVIARPELLDVRPGWGGGKLDAATVLLEPLASDDARALTEQLLAGSFRPDLLARVTDAAEGNPLFIEQIVAMLAEKDGPISDAFEIPPTIQALLATRLDGLPVGERRLAERASVVGRVFERVAVGELSSTEERPGVSDGLRGLVRRELIRPDPMSRAPDDVFRFRHLLIRDAAYEGLSKRDRADLHARFAAWLEATAGDRVQESEEIIGYHLEQAVAYLREIGADQTSIEHLAGRASLFLLRSGRRAFERNDIGAAVNLYDRARSMADPRDALLVAEMPHIGIAHGLSGDFEGALASHAVAQQVARATSDRTTELRSLVLETDLKRQMGRLDRATARAVMETAIPEAIELGDHFAAARALSALSDGEADDGFMERALEASQQGLEQAKAGGFRRESLRQLHGVISALVFGPRPIPEVLERCRSIVTEAGIDPTFEAICRSVLALALAQVGDVDAAREHAAQAEITVADLGYTIPILIVNYATSEVFRVLGDLPSRERAVIAQVDATGRGTANPIERAVAAALLAEVRAVQGRLEEARVLVDTALGSELEGGGALYVALVHRGVARGLAAAGEFERAEAHLAIGDAVLRPTDDLYDRAEFALAGAEVAAAGHLEVAAVRAAEAAALFAAKGDMSSGLRVQTFREQYGLS